MAFRSTPSRVSAAAALTVNRVLLALIPCEDGIFSNLIFTAPFNNSRSIEFEIRDQCKLGFPNIQNALQLFDQMLLRKPTLPILNYNQLFTAISKMKYYSTVPPLYKQMMSTLEIQPDLFTFNILINCFCRIGQSKSAFSVLGHIYRSRYHPNIVTLTTFLNGLCIDGKVSDAVELFRKMQKMGYPCDVVTYGVIIDGLCKTKKVHKALELLREMEDEPWCVRPNAPVYNAIIDGFCKQDLVDDSLELFLQMKKKAISPNVITYSSLIDALCISSRWEEALGYLEEMISCGISPNVTTYNILIDAFCKVGLVKRAHEILAVMIRNGEEPDTITYSALISGYCSIGRLKSAVALFNTMVRKDCKPDIVTYNTLLDGFFKMACPNEENHFCDQMHVHDTRSSEWLMKTNELFAVMIRKEEAMTIVTYNTLIKGYCSIGKMDSAVKVFNTIVSNKCEPDIITYDIFIDGCKSSCPYEANHLFSKMQIQTNGLNTSASCKLFDGTYENKCFGVALKLFHLIQEIGLAPTIVTYNTLIMGLVRVGQLNHARELFNLISPNGLKCSVITYNTIIGGLCKEGMTEEAGELFNQMEEDGCAPDEIIFKALIGAHLEQNNELEARQLIHKMTERGFLTTETTGIRSIQTLET